MAGCVAMEVGSDTPRNALAQSRSPYLLQHAGNPVEWHEWGEEAFALARERDAPKAVGLIDRAASALRRR